MKTKENAENIALIIGVVSVILPFVCFFAFLFFNGVVRYKELDMDYDDLMREELTYEKWEEIRKLKLGSRYSIYFREYEQPFCVDNIAHKKISRAALNRLKSDETLELYFCETSNRDYAYEICQMSSSTEMLLSLSDYIEVHRKNQIGLMIVSPILVFGVLFMGWFVIRNIIPIKANGGLGKRRIEYRIGENIIHVYDARQVCSLVINGKIFDTSPYGKNFCLKGMVKSEGRVFRIQVRLGMATMWLYCNDRMVVKKRMLY